MAQTSFSKSRLLALLSVGCVALSALAYGCSDDATTTPAATKDAGGTDAPVTPTDSGGAKDTGVTPDTGPGVDAAIPTAVANIAPTSGTSTVMGTATFVQTTGSTVTVTITGAPPGLHGMHIHAGGSCDNLDDAGPGTAALGHWNVDDAGHAFPDAATRHIGDMGNMTIDDAGAGSLTMTNPMWTVLPGPNSVVGHAVVFHAGEDDGTTQPTGNSGGRIGCGVIAQTK